MSKEQLLETLLKDAMKHLNDTLDKALSLEKDLEKANEMLEIAERALNVCQKETLSKPEDAQAAAFSAINRLNALRKIK